ncbi:MAG: hypothetical protein IIX54_04900 [Clostridia bacterium]|nr:hypothetical protein [Clostridia bacterium]
MEFFKNFSFRKLLYNKKFTISLSIIVAFIFWLVIVIDQNPEREQTFSNLPIEITTEGTVWEDQGLEVVNEITQKASVTVFGPNYIVSSLKADDIKISADISVVNGAGNYTVNLSAVRNSDVSGYSFLSVSPSSISVQFDYYDTKEFTITPKVEGYQTIEGVSYDDAVVANAGDETISVKGPRSILSKINSVIAYAFTDKTISSTSTFDAKLKFLDVDGNELETRNLELGVETIKISLPVSKTKVITFTPSFINAPNQNVINSLMAICRSDVDKFTIAGPPEVIDSIDKLEFTLIDVTKISSSNSKLSFEVAPVLPNGVRITDGIDVATVTFDLSNFAVKKIKITNFDDEGTLPSGLNVTYSSEISVEVCGLKTVVNSLSASDYYLAVDLSNATKGESLVKAVLKTRNDANVWQTVSCEIKVIIK